MNTHPSPEAKAIARLIRAQMAIRDVTQTPLAEHLNISQPTLSRKLKGQKNFELDEIFAACDFLGLNAGEIIARGIQMASEGKGNDFSIIEAGDR